MLLSVKTARNGILIVIKVSLVVGILVSSLTFTEFNKTKTSKALMSERIDNSSSVHQHNCGKSNYNTRQWPWTVYLHKSSSVSNKSTKYFCSGTLIHSQYVLTSAYCLALLNDRTISAIVGINNNNIHSNHPESSNNIYYASKLIISSKFNTSTILNDIGIIKLNKPVKQSSRVAAICLPGSSKDAQDVYNKKLLLTAWERSSSVDAHQNQMGLPAVKLQQSIVRVSANTRICSKQNNNFDWTKQYCVLADNHYKTINMCNNNNDFGSSLIYFKNGVWFIYGISSFFMPHDLNLNKCDPSQPGYYTQVAIYSDWIRYAIANL